MATIVQDYGPIYGEVVNGTVQGRPNGSVYVPLSNTIEVSLSAGAEIYANGSHLQLSPRVQIVANAQDLSSYVQTQMFTDASCTTPYGTPRNFTAGGFNFSVSWIVTDSTAPTTGTTYYIRAQLMNNGVAVATSNVVTAVGR